MVPGYKKIKEISHGPLTSVILCKQESLDRDVMLKILHPQHASDKELVERFIREAKMYARLKHDNIVNVIDLGKENGSYFIAMEYVDGCSLDEFIKKHSSLPLDIAIYIIIKVLTGLEYAHHSGIIHRDIKPSNILISKKGDVKITDFGLAKPLNLSAITEQGNILGTPSYLAPELARSEPANISSDIFAMGATFYELLTKEKIFEGESVAATINNILNLKPLPVHKKREDVQEWLGEIVLQMIEKKSNRRPDSCSLIISEIKKNVNNISKSDFHAFLTNKDQSTPRGIGSDKSSQNKKSYKFIYSFTAVAIIAVFVVYNLYYLGNDFPTNKPEQSVLLDTLDSIRNDTLKSNKINLATIEADQKNELTLPKNNAKKITSNVKSEREQKVENQIVPGKLFVNVIPWADVIINGEKIDTTPLSKAIELMPGKYKIELKNPAFMSYSESINILAGKSDSLYVRLEQAFGNLKLTVVPWGKIYINNEYVDTTPFNDPIKVKSGQNELEIINPNFAKHTELLDIKAGETLEKTIYLKN